MDSLYETILYKVKNKVAYLTLNRPDSLNAFNEIMNKEIVQALKIAEKDPSVRALVIQGAGRAFCSGEDLKSLDKNIDLGEIIKKRYTPMLKQIASFSKPIIASVNGVAAGAGFSLALACDFRIVSDKATFIQAFINIGLVPDTGNLFYLPKLVGTAKAIELSILGEKITAGDAEKYGLVTKVVPFDELESETENFAEKLANKPTKAIELIKNLIRKSYETRLDEFLEYEAYSQKIAGFTEDFKEGVQSFVEKRKPVFQGR